MRNYEFNKLDMYMLIQTGMKKRKDLWENIPYLVESLSILDTNIETIGKASGLQNSTIKGYTIQKKIVRNKLEMLMLFVAMQIKSYAAFNQNDNLNNQMHYTKSSLKLCRDKDLVFDADTLHAIATEHLAAIANFGVTTTILNDLHAAKVNFAEAVNAPILQRQLQKEATIIIQRTIAETDYLLRTHLDRQMLIFQSIDPAFYNLYTIERKIHGSPTIKIAMRIKVIDALTKQALPKALIILKDHNIKRLTSPLGQIVIRNLKEGEHIVTVTLAGYQKKTPTVTHVKGETTLVVVEMERENGEA